VNVYICFIECLECFCARDEPWKSGDVLDELIGSGELYFHILKRWDIQSRHEALQELAGAVKL
jgi:hypothetical protein